MCTVANTFIVSCMRIEDTCTIDVHFGKYSHTLLYEDTCTIDVHFGKYSHTLLYEDTCTVDVHCRAMLSYSPV